MDNDALSQENDIRPDFLKNNKKEDGKKLLNSAETAATTAQAVKTGQVSQAGGKAAGLYTARNTERKPDETQNKSKISTGLKAAAPFMIAFVMVVGLVLLIVALPVVMIGALDYNLQKVLGFTETVGILEKQGEYVTAELAASGEMPSEYASSLASNGVLVGQVAEDGNFYQTNVYIANIAEKDNLVAAASGFSYVSDEEGELALLFDGELIKAGDFVAKVESSPELYAAYSAAADISTKYYYGEDVEAVYKDMGLSRGNFNDWNTTGNYEADHQEFSKILEKTLNKGSNLVVGGAYDDTDKEGGRMSSSDDYNTNANKGGTYVAEVTGVEAGDISSNVSENTREYIYKWWPHWEMINGVNTLIWTPSYSNNSTERAAELLNTAVSSGEPYLASNAFIAVEEAVQRARVDGDGPVNHVMNTLTEGTSVSYQNVETGETETTDLSILETKNFRAAVSDSNYDKAEAQNFSRDRILKTTGEAEEIKAKDVIRRTTIGTGGRTSANSVVRNGKTGSEADSSVVAKANENLNLSQAKENSETFQSVIGGNRIIEGGSFLSNTINMHVIGAMPSNAETIAAYHQEVEEVMARKAEAERATLSPFDISSPNTFMGSIVHNLASVMLGSFGSTKTAFSAVGSVGGAAGTAIANLTDSATADSSDDEYTTMSGLGCETVQTAGGIEGDLYCTSHNTVSTGYMANTQSAWDSVIDEEGYKDFTLLAMERYATVGVKNSEVCETYNNLHGSLSSKIGSFFKKMFDAYEVCEIKTDDNDNITDPDELEKLAIYNGAKYSFGSEGSDKNELYSGYAMYQEVRKLLTGEETTTAKIKDEYYAKYPKDNSAAGVIARRSGLTKDEALIALGYADYLNVIANYDATDRYLFNGPLIVVEQPILISHEQKIAEDLYAWRQKETEYADVRNRNFVV